MARRVRASQRSKRSRPFDRWYNARSLVETSSAGWNVCTSAVPANQGDRTEKGTRTSEREVLFELVWVRPRDGVGPVLYRDRGDHRSDSTSVLTTTRQRGLVFPRRGPDGERRVRSERRWAMSMARATSSTMPARRMFKRVSPPLMWLNSCTTRPWSSSRVRCSSAPLVTATTASSSFHPQANALMVSTRSTTMGRGERMLAAIASSATMLQNFSSDSWIDGLASRAPARRIICSLPPPSAELSIHQPPKANTSAITVLTVKNVPDSRHSR